MNWPTSVPILHHTTIYLFSASTWYLERNASLANQTASLLCIMCEMAFPRWPFNNTLCLWGVM